MSRRLEGMVPLLQLRDDISPNAAGRPRHVVALAASAGGLAALSRILSALPAGFPAPILVLQHLDPRHRSLLAEILGPRTGLRVAQAQAGEPLAVGTALVAPPGHHLLVGLDGVLSLADTDRIRFSRPSADGLFASLAESWGPGAIAGVVSGRGPGGGRRGGRGRRPTCFSPRSRRAGGRAPSRWCSRGGAWTAPTGCARSSAAAAP